MPIYARPAIVARPLSEAKQIIRIIQQEDSIGIGNDGSRIVIEKSSPERLYRIGRGMNETNVARCKIAIGNRTLGSVAPGKIPDRQSNQEDRNHCHRSE